MSFKDSVAADNLGVFLNLAEFADLRTVRYDGEEYTDIPIVMRGLKEQERRQIQSDHAQGLYLVTSVVHCRLSDLGGVQPERGTRIKINDWAAGDSFMNSTSPRPFARWGCFGLSWRR